MKQSCDLCGASDAKFLAKVAGTEATVCARCASMGTIIEQVREEPKPTEIRKIEREKQQLAPRTEEVVGDIGKILRKKREEMNLKQEDMGKKIQEHESMVKRIEHGYVPSLKIAHKLEKVIHVKLTEYVNQNEQEYTTGKSGGTMTLGDIMIIKKSEKR